MTTGGDTHSDSGIECDELPTKLDWPDLERQDPLYVVEDERRDDPDRRIRHPQRQNVTRTLRKRPTAYLDGLRGLAAFLVYMCHHAPWWYGIPSPLDHGFGYQGEHYIAQLPFIRSLFTGGNAAVAIFFTLSGYVLSIGPLRLLADQNDQRSHVYRGLVAATVRRPLRLFIPPAGISLIFACVMQLPTGLAPTLAWPHAKESLDLELANWFKELCLMMNPFEKHGVFEHWFPYDPPAWTMAMEFKGSCVVFFLIALFSTATPRHRMYLFGVLGMYLLLIYQWSLACFMGGVVLACNDLEDFDNKVLLHRFSDKAKGIGRNVVFVAAWYLLCQTAGHREVERSSNTWGWYYLTQLIPSNYYEDEFWRFWNTIGAFWFVYTVLRLSWLQRFFSRPTLQYLGRISFSLYLIHIPLEWTVADRLYRVVGVIRQDFTTPFDSLLWIPDFGPLGFSSGFLIMQAVILPMNLYLAELGTKYLDEPGVKAGRWLVGKLRLDKPSSSSSSSSSFSTVEAASSSSSSSSSSSGGVLSLSSILPFKYPEKTLPS